jgi:FG-GAP-like repeat
MIPFRSRSDSLTFTPRLSAIGSENDFSKFPIVSLPIADLSWHIKGVADLNGNGPADIIFQHDSEVVVIWEMNASGAVQSLNLAALNPGPEWHLVGVRDMTNDAKADILFQHDSGGAAIWQNYSSAG